jgi:hypothetical protein
MRRPVGVKWILLFFRWTRFFSPAEWPLSPCFHPHSPGAIRSLGACWAFSYQPVLPFVCRPVVLFFSRRTWARRLTQSPELGFGFCLFTRHVPSVKSLFLHKSPDPICLAVSAVVSEGGKVAAQPREEHHEKASGLPVTRAIRRRGGSYGLVFGTCAVNPKGSCSILGLNPLQFEVTSGDNPADPSSVIF